jgi:hypothetical protein
MRSLRRPGRVGLDRQKYVTHAATRRHNANRSMRRVSSAAAGSFDP